MLKAAWPDCLIPIHPDLLIALPVKTLASFPSKFFFIVMEGPALRNRILPYQWSVRCPCMFARLYIMIPAYSNNLKDRVGPVPCCVPRIMQF